MKNIHRLGLALGTATLFAAPAQAQIKIALIEAFSGPFAKPGESVLAHVRGEAEAINARGGVLGQKLEVVTFDNRTSPQESLVAFKSVTDQGIRYVIQGTSSAVTHALVDAAGKWNERNPDKAVLIFNFAALDPALTNEKCSFWHFRFDSNSDMKLEAVTNSMEKDKTIKKVFLIGQDYAYGHQIAKGAREMLKKKRPDVQLVGEELHPIGRIKDFSPYVAKIIASGADTVITGNWGNDLALLIKAAKDAGLKARFYTFNGGSVGMANSIGAAGVGRVINIAEWQRNLPERNSADYVTEFNKKYGFTEFSLLRVKNMMQMVSKAIDTARTTDAAKVATALEDMRYTGYTGEVWMRKSDHQIHQPLYLSVWSEKDGKQVRFDSEGTGFGWKMMSSVGTRDSQLPTTCVMTRPAA